MLLYGIIDLKRHNTRGRIMGNDNGSSGLNQRQVEIFFYEYLHPICPYTEEPLNLKRWGDVFFLHDYYSYRKWKGIDDKHILLSKNIYWFKEDTIGELVFEFYWALMKICRTIPEKTIYLYRVPSSNDTLQIKSSSYGEYLTPIDKIIKTAALDSGDNRTALSFLKKFYCEDKEFIDCRDHIFRKYPIVPNHERSKRKIKKATFIEQIESMGIQGYLSHCDENGKKEQIACLVLDDIVTSGASMIAACKVVKRHAEVCQQPVSIYSFALARTVMKSADPPSMNWLTIEEINNLEEDCLRQERQRTKNEQ